MIPKQPPGATNRAHKVAPRTRKPPPKGLGREWRFDNIYSPLWRLLYPQAGDERARALADRRPPPPPRWGNVIPIPNFRRPGLVVPPGEMPTYDDDPRLGQTRPGGQESPPLGRTPWGTPVPFPDYGREGRRGRV